MKLDIASGQRTLPGYTGIDLWPGADIVHDLFDYPWPIETSVVEAAYVSHFVEHIPHWRPEWGNREGWWLFWEEVARVCRPGALVTIVHPYLKSVRAFADPTHVRFVPETTWTYLDAAWRRAQGLDHYDTTADFEVVRIQTREAADPIAPDLSRWDQVPDLEVELRRR